jgi:ATP-binding cassette subfamily F protein 3
MIQIKNLAKRFGNQELFGGVNLTINRGEKIGFVGSNGSGKSTLFKMIVGAQEYDDGQILTPKNYRIGTLSQHLHFTESTLAKECALALPKEEEWNFYKIERLLFGLGFSQEDLEANPNSFSGGYQIRINLVKLLATEPHMLLLDEPTNYLDILSLRWLEGFIESFEGEVILITHDREFMDRVTTHTMGIARGEIHRVKGDTTAYYEMLSLADESYERNRLNQEKKRKELEEFVAKNRARASSASLAQSKQKLLDKMELFEELANAKRLRFDFRYQETPAKVLLRAQDLGFGYEEASPLFEKLSFALAHGKRVAIIGKNGKGKSTLLNYIAQQIPHQQGTLSFHPQTAIGHFGQTNIERLNPTHTILQEIASVSKEIGMLEAQSIAGSMLFSGEQASKVVSMLSGGERSRVMLGKIIATPTNLLLLDEPTNHLDMESIDALVEAIERFRGGVVMVTHSQMMLHRLADTLIVFQEGKATYFEGDYEAFLEKIGWEEEIQQKEPKKSPKGNQKERKKERKRLIHERNEKRKPYTKAIAVAESKIEALEEELEQKSLQLSRISQGEEEGSLIELSQAIGEIQEAIEVHFEQLEEASHQDDAIMEAYAPRLKALEE